MVDSRNPGLAHRLEYMAQERFAPELRKNIRVKADADRIVEIHVGDSVATLRPHHPGNSFERLASRFDWAAQLWSVPGFGMSGAATPTVIRRWITGLRS